MDSFVVRRNIAHFRQLLKIETDQSRREMLRELLSEHAACSAGANLPERKPS